MALRVGNINGFKSGITNIAGFEQAIKFPSAELLAKYKHIETIRSCKPLKPLCEFCKEKIGLLNNDCFIKSNKAAK